VERLHEHLSGPYGREVAMALRNLVDSVVVHETVERRPHEVCVYGRLAAIMGVDLFPTMRTPSEIIEEEAFGAAAITANEEVKCSLATVRDNSTSAAVPYFSCHMLRLNVRGPKGS
jgi:hypothetical protein